MATKRTIGLGALLGVRTRLAHAGLGAREEATMSSGATMTIVIPKELAYRSMRFVAALNSRSQQLLTFMEKALHVSFEMEFNGDLYMSPDLGHG